MAPHPRNGLGLMRTAMEMAVALMFAWTSPPVLAQHGGGGHGGGSLGGSHAGAAHSGGISYMTSARADAGSGARTGNGFTPRPGVMPTTSVRLIAPAGNGQAYEPGHAQIDAAPPQHVMIGFPLPGTENQRQMISLRSSPLSFSGQGHEIWEDSPSAANRSLHSRGTFEGDGLAGRGFPRSPGPIGPRRFRRFFNPPVFFGGYPFGFPFWGLGFGFGGGPGCYSWGDSWDPAWGSGFESCTSGYFEQGGAAPYDIEASGSDATDSEYGPYAPQNAPEDNSNLQNPASQQGQVLLYFKDGTVYEASDYWVADGRLHYVTASGAEYSSELNDIDIQRTVDENAARGISITLRPAPISRPPQDPSQNQPAGTSEPLPTPQE